jgi:exodeoxyribonuclease V alpha subunit
VVVADGDELVAGFGTGDGHRLVALGRLADVVPLHALTVHRSQGSQFGRVTVLLPEAGSPLATREMLYTAVTRAMGSVHLVGSPEAVVAAVGRPVARATGLQQRLG